MTPLGTLRAQVPGLYTPCKKARKCGATRPVVSDRRQWRTTGPPAHLLATPPSQCHHPLCPSQSLQGGVHVGEGGLCYFNSGRNHTDDACGCGCGCSLEPYACPAQGAAGVSSRTRSLTCLQTNRVQEKQPGSGGDRAGGELPGSATG